MISQQDAAAGHSGGDIRLNSGAFVGAVRSGDWSQVPTDGRESLRTHRIVWAAEEARRGEKVVTFEVENDC